MKKALAAHHTGYGIARRAGLLLFAVVFSSLTFLGCEGDSPITAILTGRGLLPPQFTGVLGEVPADNSAFQVLDLSRLGTDAAVVATGATDGDGVFAATVPSTSSVAVIITDDVRVSGLLVANQGNRSKNLDGVTDVACEAGLTAVADGSIAPEDLTQERIDNLESGAAVVVASTDIDFTDADGSRTAAVATVRAITSDGANPPS